MRVLHIPYTYFPDPAGGTEIYVAQLVRELRNFGIESVVAAPGPTSARYNHEGVLVARYAVGDALDRGEYNDAAANPSAVAALDALLAELRPDVMHFHAYTRGVPGEAGDTARQMGIPVVVTYHSPTVTCARGTLIRNGEVVCDGALIVSRCSRCMFQLRGTPAVPAALLSRLPPSIGRAVRRVAPRAGGAAAGLRMTEMMKSRHERVRSHLRKAAYVVAPSRWVGDLVTGEGVLPERLVVSPQGIDEAFEPRREARPGAPVRFALPARYSPEKGIGVVLAAMESIPSADIRLDVFGPSQNVEGRDYRAMLDARAARDVRVRMHDAVEPARIVAELARADAVLVPSLTKETGPLVVLEAFAAGTPVIGSDLGGIAERVRHGVDGLLVPPGDVGGWADAMASFAQSPELRATLTRGVQPPRRMSDVAEEMASLYSQLVGSGRALPAATRDEVGGR